MLGSECDLKIYARNLGYKSGTTWGPQNHFFRRLGNLAATLTAYVFGMKHDIHNRASVLTTKRAVLHRRLMS